MGKQTLPDFDSLKPEGIDEDFLLKSMIAYNNIVVLLQEAEKKQNLPVLLSNIERLKSMAKYYMKKVQLLDGRIKYYQSINKSLEVENKQLMNERLLLICEIKGREPYKRAKEMLDQFFEGK